MTLNRKINNKFEKNAKVEYCKQVKIGRFTIKLLESLLICEGPTGHYARLKKLNIKIHYQNAAQIRQAV